MIFETSKICPFAIAYKVDETVISKEPEIIKAPSLISPRAREGLYYSGQDMELVTQIYDDSSFIMAREALVSNMSTVKIPSVKTGDYEILDTILNVIINIGTSIGL